MTTQWLDFSNNYNDKDPCFDDAEHKGFFSEFQFFQVFFRGLQILVSFVHDPSS